MMPLDEHVQLVDRGPNSRWTDTSATTLNLKWSPLVLSTHSNAKVLIRLRGYNKKLVLFRINLHVLPYFISVHAALDVVFLRQT